MPLPMLDLITRDGGLIEAPGNRTLLTRIVSRRWKTVMPPMPFGWAREKVIDRHAYVYGPAWYILPRRWMRELRWAFVDWALRVDLARTPYQGCWHHEIVWFPDAPRFI